MSTKQALQESLPRDMTLHDELMAVGNDDVVGMTNLFSEDTGVDGIIFVSTEMAAHGPRVKYSLKAGRHQPSFSVSISREPRVVANSLPERTVIKMAPRVIEWVKLNNVMLLEYWKNGNDLSRRQEAAFFDSLKKLSGD